MTKTLTFDISHLMNEQTGKSERYSFKGEVDFEDFDLKSEVSGTAEIMRIDEGLNVVATNVKGKISSKCAKCLKSFSNEITIKFAERLFLIDKPAIIEDPNDIYLIDKKHLRLDIKEMLRQEFILHFPVISVCSTRCKGICPICGKNRNIHKCKCEEDKAVNQTINSPLSALKELLKQYHGKTSGTQKKEKSKRK